MEFSMSLFYRFTARWVVADVQAIFLDMRQPQFAGTCNQKQTQHEHMRL